ncbi:hypothetical protein FQR65_LT09592 [Abscondita terminalis]|nr:hypothetical protein FQR65_LT09592 [Abscondita terminalis]
MVNQEAWFFSAGIRQCNPKAVFTHTPTKAVPAPAPDAMHSNESKYAGPANGTSNAAGVEVGCRRYRRHVGFTISIHPCSHMFKHVDDINPSSVCGLNSRIATMTKSFKYDVLTLIELVESKPYLWNKTTDSFKDKIEKQKACKEVFGFFEKISNKRYNNPRSETDMPAIPPASDRSSSTPAALPDGVSAESSHLITFHPVPAPTPAPVLPVFVKTAYSLAHER